MDTEWKVLTIEREVNKTKYLYISRNTLIGIQKVCGLDRVEEEKYDLNSKGMWISTIPVNKSLNSTEDNYIHNDSQGVFWINSKNQKIKLGKIISQLWKSLDSTQIEQCVTKWKAIYTVDTSKVIVGTDVCRVYDLGSVGGSCMADNGEWMEIYEDLDTKIAYILDDDGDLEARALLWDKNVYQDNDEDNIVTILDRIFFNNETSKITLKTWAEERGYLTSFPNNVKTCKSINSGYDGVPYIDSMYKLIESEIGGGEWQLTNCSMDIYKDTLQSTNGSSDENCGISSIDNNENSVYCEDVDGYRHIDGVYYNNTHECYYAYHDDLVSMDYGDWYHCEDERIVYTEDDGYQWLDNCYFAYDTDEWYSSTYSLILCDDVGEYVTEDNATYVEDLDHYVYSADDLYCDKQGRLWSNEEAYLEENGEDNE